MVCSTPDRRTGCSSLYWTVHAKKLLASFVIRVRKLQEKVLCPFGRSSGSCAAIRAPSPRSLLVCVPQPCTSSDLPRHSLSSPQIPPTHLLKPEHAPRVETGATQGLRGMRAPPDQGKRRSSQQQQSAPGKVLEAHFAPFANVVS